MAHLYRLYSHFPSNSVWTASTHLHLQSHHQYLNTSIVIEPSVNKHRRTPVWPFQQVVFARYCHCFQLLILVTKYHALLLPSNSEMENKSILPPQWPISVHSFEGCSVKSGESCSTWYSIPSQLCTASEGQQWGVKCYVDILCERADSKNTLVKIIGNLHCTFVKELHQKWVLLLAMGRHTISSIQFVWNTGNHPFLFPETGTSCSTIRRCSWKHTVMLALLKWQRSQDIVLRRWPMLQFGKHRKKTPRLPLRYL